MIPIASRPWLGRLLQVLLSPLVLSGLILAACLAVTAGLWQGARAAAELEARSDFDFRVRELLNSMDQRMQTYVQVLYGVQGLFASSEFVDRAEFHTYVVGQTLHLRLPGIHGVGYMRLVEGARQAEFTASVRREGFPDFAISPPGERAWLAPVLFLEPFSGSNLKAFGYDPWSEPVRRAALEQARDSAQPAMSGKIRLRQESQWSSQSGFLIVLPVYHNRMPLHTLAQRRAAIRGWAYAPFRVPEVMAGLGGGRSAGLDVSLYDGERTTPDALMYGSGAGHEGAARATRQQIGVAGHRWTLWITPRAGPAGAHAEQAQWIAGTGLALAALLALLTWLLARSRARAGAALARAGLLTRELEDGQVALVAMAGEAQRSQAVLRSILDSTIDGILVDDLNGMVLNSNRRFRELWNVPEQLDWEGDGAVLLSHLADQLCAGEVLLQAEAPRGARDGQRHLLRLKDGRVIEQHIRALQLGNAAARLWSFRDITEPTQGEQRETTRRHVLELLATGAPLQTILEAVVTGVEQGHPEMLCSILLLDEDGERLLVGAAPSLPAFFNAAVHGKSIHRDQGSCCRAARTGQRVIVEDMRSDPAWAGYADLVARARLGACWSDPIISASGKVLGTFAIYHHEAHRPSLANIALIEQAAHLAGIAIEQAQAAVALRAGEARFRSLYEHAPVALWEQDWSGVRAALAEMELSGVDDLALYLLANGSQLRRLAGLVRILDVNPAALAQVGALAGQLGLLSLEQNFDQCAAPVFARAVAALAQGKQLFVSEGSFVRLDGMARQNELTLLVMPGHTHSLDYVIVSTLDITERKRLNDELLVLATTDFLTGLPNRREFMLRLDGEQARLQRDIGGCAAVLMLDLDHFKRVNDEFGHAAGDAVLRHLAGLMRDCQRKIDMLGRVGGEEFAILLPGTDLAAAAVFAERLRASIAATPLALAGHSLSVTVSVGIAALCADDANGDAALVRADRALYCAKGAGRNRVECMDGRPDGAWPAVSA